MRMLKAGVTYFALTFAAGFGLGTVRTFWLAPKLGTRTAELLETPIMLVVIVLAARWVVRRQAVPFTRGERLGVGMVALGLLLVAEFGLVPWLRRLSIPQYLASRDPVAGAVYVVSLALFAVMPLLVSPRRNQV